jgi:hypothetical protein
MGGACGTHGGAKIFSSGLVGRPEGQGPLEEMRRGGSKMLQCILEK